MCFIDVKLTHLLTVFTLTMESDDLGFCHKTLSYEDHFIQFKLQNFFA